MASSAFGIIAGEFVEERLFAGVLTGSFLQSEDLLDMLEDVNVRGMRQRTLLHVGVRLGKADWVEELLARGADTDLKDDSELNALSSAEEMVRRFPEEFDRSLILKLVTLVHRRDQVMMHRPESSSSRINDHITPVARNNQDIESLKSSLDALRQEMKSLMCQLSSLLEELKTQVCGRDTLLRCLEEAVTSTVEDVTSIKMELVGEAAFSQAQLDRAAARQECVDAMLRKTTFVFENGVDKMRRVYERMYDVDDCTACIIKYLCWDDRVKVMVDCGSYNYGRMKKRFVQLDGTQGEGSCYYSSCDFEIDTVYSGACGCDTNVCAFLVWGLAQLSLKLVFGNEGRPYSKGDVEREREWMRAVKEAEEADERRKKKGWFYYYWFTDALYQKTELARVCHLAAAVPTVIALFESTRRHYQQNFFPFFSMYSNHVMPTLLAKARR